MLRPSVILSVRYRNHFPVVQFQNQAHIWNPRGTGHVFKTMWGAAGAPSQGHPRRPNFFYYFFIAAEGGVSGRPVRGAPGAQIFILYFFQRRRRRWFPKGGARGATPP